jgi:hypothetical protein
MMEAFVCTVLMHCTKPLIESNPYPIDKCEVSGILDNLNQPICSDRDLNRNMNPCSRMPASAIIPDNSQMAKYWENFNCPL